MDDIFALPDVGMILFDEIDDYGFMIDENGSIIQANKTVLNNLGYTLVELMNMHALALYPPEEREKALNSLAQIPAGPGRECLVNLTTKSGR